MIKEIKLSELKQKVQEGVKLKELAEYYGIAVMQMRRCLREAGLQIRKLHYPKFKLVDDTVTVSENSDTAGNVEEQTVNAENNTTNTNVTATTEVKW